MTESAAGWHPDPSGRFELRYWDGTSWTQSVSSGGRQVTDTAIVQAPPPGVTPEGPVATASPPAVDDPGSSPGPGWWIASDGNWYPPEGSAKVASSRKKPLLIGAAVVVIAVACGSGSSGYNAAIERSFMDGCMKGATPRSFCECGYRTVKREIPFEQFKEIDAGRKAMPSDVTRQIREDCA